MDITDKFNKIEDIINLYEELGKSDYIGEKISQIEHALESAHFAEKKKEYLMSTYKLSDNEFNQFVLGCLLHDIGHLIGMKYDLTQMENVGILRHENIGAEVLKKIGFGDIVCNVVLNHVNAKRYLCNIDKNYYSNLSDASKITLKHQGGVMNEDEKNSFEKDHFKDLYIEMRRIDEESKVENMVLPNLRDYVKMMEECLNI